MERPEFVTDEQLKYLNTLNDSKETPMGDASNYIWHGFDVTKDESIKIVQYWRSTLKNK